MSARIIFGTDLNKIIGIEIQEQIREMANRSVKLNKLENKVEKHNNVIERTFKLEERTELQELEIEHAYERIDKLENLVGLPDGYKNLPEVNEKH